MSEQERNHYINRHEEIGDEVGRCRQNTGWMIVTAVLAVLLTASVCFNVYLLVSRGGDMRRHDQDMQMMRPGQNDWRGGNNGTYKYRGGNPRGDAPSDTKDKDGEQKDNNESSDKS